MAVAAKKVAAILHQIGAVSTLTSANQADWYTWSSQIKSPLYCDNRRISSFLPERTFVYHQLALLIKDHFPHVNYLFATATGGMIPASFVAADQQWPVGYVRGNAKAHGLSRQIEGQPAVDSQIVVVEDLVTTGQSLWKVVAALREANMKVLGAVAIFSYNLKITHRLFTEHEVPFYHLCTWDDFADVTDIKIGQDFLASLNERWS